MDLKQINAQENTPGASPINSETFDIYSFIEQFNLKNIPLSTYVKCIFTNELKIFIKFFIATWHIVGFFID